MHSGQKRIIMQTSASCKVGDLGEQPNEISCISSDPISIPPKSSKVIEIQITAMVAHKYHALHPRAPSVGSSGSYEKK